MPLQYDGTDDRVVTTNVTGAPTTYPFGFGVVCRLTAVTNFPALFAAGLIDPAGSRSGYTWQVNNAQKLYVYNAVGLTTVTGTVNVPLNAWIFLGLACASATSHRLYCYNYETRSEVFNETLATNLGTLTAPAGTCKLGCSEGPSATFANFWAGILSWLAVFNRDLTIQGGDVFRSMAQLGPTVQFTPTLLYAFNEMAGTTVRDHRGTSNDGTMTNFPGAPWVARSLGPPVA